MAEKDYQRLTWARGRQLGFVAFSLVRTSLWLGKDHLLCVDSNGYSESYKRFYFQDLQAVTIHLTARRQMWNWFLGVPTILCAMGWAYDLLDSGSLDLAAITVGVTITLLFSVPLLINNLLGPTCVCQVRTAVQTEEVAPLCRLRQTRRILDRLRPLIAQAQGQLTTEEIPARIEQWAAANAAASAMPEPQARYVVDDPNLPPRIMS